ncbi:SDR family NAD(P)-dependent oxidoreductase [Rudanella paleaurantiibacter]|uniref:SDR family NAD(P)-dependent oxidoreductase n=1 Tax=Rudanella paleaurantiibacter TaxID=2614655 RepID=A0A7J5U6R5_9BACT|nr:SDR family NAD(P)-dependent oxidoreductase [Rudanella paleaurantiibacter]KAB7733287.1 SDR family NAD(P)-dependent oxidoreductase [Rudanella paleaurantiibacter]
MNVLITGGAGFIGSTLAGRLLREGYRVSIVDNFNSAYDPALKRQNIRRLGPAGSVMVYEGDVRQPQFMRHVLRHEAVDVVVHLAGLAGVRPSLQNPTAYFDHNLNGTTVLLDAMRDTGVSRVVVASSSSVYGNRVQGPFLETDPADEPVSPYALSKRAVELVCSQYSRLYGLNAYCLRLFTVYGPRQRPDMAISRFLHQLYRGQPVRLFGDGHSQRDYTYVDDIVDGMVRAIRRVSGYEVINLGSAAPVSLLELVWLLRDITGRHSPIEWQADQPGDVPLTYADIDKARRLLGYAPATNLREGLTHMVEQLGKPTVLSLS